MNTSIDMLDSRLIAIAKAFIDELIKLRIPHVLWCTIRTTDEQVALYFQGRASLRMVNILRKKAKMRLLSEKENGYTVTERDGVNDFSNHQMGLALDVVPRGGYGQPVWPSATDPRWLTIAEVGEKFGLKWGGRWSSPDFPHYEYLEV